MTNQEALDILTRHNAWRRDNETEFPELPDSPALIGEAIDTAIQGLEKLERMRRRSSLTPKTHRELWVEDDLAKALILLRALVDLPFPLPKWEEYKRIEVIEKIYKFLAELE